MAGLPPAELEYIVEHKGDNRGPVALAAIIVVQVIAAIAVVLRLIARCVSKQTLKADDHWISISWVCEDSMLFGIDDIEKVKGP